MPTIKIYPPSQLPERNLTETQFSIWKEELEVYLSQEKSFKIFLPGQPYETWESAEAYNDRIRNLNEGDEVRQSADITHDEAIVQNEEKLADMRTDLRTLLAIVGKCVSEGHYNSVIRHSISLNWIYNMIKSDYDIQAKGIHFFHITEVKYDHEKTTPIAFYNKYRTIVVNNLAKARDVIKYKNNEILDRDEKMTPMLEDIVLLNVISEIDARLPTFVKNHYNHKMMPADRLMDFKTDILINIPSFLSDIEKNEQNNLSQEASLNAFKRFTSVKQRKNSAQPQLYCRMCYLAKMPREIFISHNIGDEKCSQLSSQDRFKLKQQYKLNAIKDFDVEDISEDQIAAKFGYSCKVNDESEDEVKMNLLNSNYYHKLHRNEESTCGFMKPIASQILTVFVNKQNKIPVHIELDSGASINFCQESAVIALGFKISYNKQISKLGDGKTKIESIGEINEIFYRNNWEVKFRAAVCKKLSSPFIGGTVFMKDNNIEQDFAKDVIRVHNKAVTVQPTNPISLLPVAPLTPQLKEVKSKNESKFLTFDQKWLLPGQDVEVAIPNKLKEQQIVAVEPYELNINGSWPNPAMVEVKNGNISLINDTSNPINLGKEVKRCKLSPVVHPSQQVNDYYEYEHKIQTDMDAHHVAIDTSHIQCEEAKKLVEDAHHKYTEVFNKDLSKGYNNYYGVHECSLNWASAERPAAAKVHVPSYDHELKILQQEVMDHLTDQNVLLIPQEHQINVQSVCPSFLQRKQRAKSKPKNELVREDVRLLINFGPVNEMIKPMPNHVPKIDDVLIKLGRWKYVICIDLYNGYFQLNMRADAIPWLGVQTPFGGMRVIARAGQGLMGMAEEFEELTSKILKQEMQEGLCAKIVDDIYIGGQTQKETALNYIRVLQKFHNANLKIAADKTKIFPETVDVLGWVWRQGGKLEASPHRKLALENTKVEDIKTIRDMRSWIGLFKTLHIATPHLATLLGPFEDVTAGQSSNEPFEWTFSLEQAFKAAKAKIKQLVTLYLPSPDDQLILEVDAAKGGLGHVLYAIVDGEKRIVRLHSAKLDLKHKNWFPCEMEALAFATGI